MDQPNANPSFEKTVPTMIHPAPPSIVFMPMQVVHLSGPYQKSIAIVKTTAESYTIDCDTWNFNVAN
jgi:hypothetical protein